MESDYYGEKDQSKPNSSRDGTNEDSKDAEQIANILDQPISNISNWASFSRIEFCLK